MIPLCWSRAIRFRLRVLGVAVAVALASSSMTARATAAPASYLTPLDLEREGGVLFTSDLFFYSDTRLMFVPAEHMHDPEQARRTAEQLLDLDFAVLCTGHGVPVTSNPKGAIRAALEHEA